MSESTHDRHDTKDAPADNQPTEPEPGDVVVDREDEDPDEAVVIDLLQAPADDWIAYETDDGKEVTVAEDNPNYAEDATVAAIVFVDDLLEHRPEYDGEQIPIAYAEGFKFYSFPRPRLERVGEYEPPEPELDEDLEPVETRLAEGAAVKREERDGEIVLVVEKLGEEYVVTPSGSVEGDGAVRDRLEAVVEEVLG